MMPTNALAALAAGTFVGLLTLQKELVKKL